MLLGSIPVYAQSADVLDSGVRCTRMMRADGLPDKPARASSPASSRRGTRCERMSYGPGGMLPNQPPRISLVPFASSIRLGPNSMALGVIAVDPDDDTMLYTWQTTGGKLSGDGSQVTWDLSTASPGPHKVTVEVDDGCGCLAWAATKELHGPVAMSTARWASGVAEADGIIYVAGGYNPARGGHVTALEAFDVAANRFSTKALPPGVQTGGAAGVIRNVLYVAGGSDCCLNTRNLMAYTIASNSWATRAAPLSPHGNGPAGAAIDGRFYVAGGTNIDASASLAVLEEYDPATNTWTLKAPMPTARHDVGSAVIDGVLYVVGGANRALGTLGTVEAYDPETNTWTAKAPLPTPRSDLVVGAIGGMLYAAGGRTAAGAVSLVEAYDPETNTWHTMPSMLTARAGARGAVVDDVLYIFGGYVPGTDIALSSVESIRSGKK